jgi:mannose-6-phosphate isomerase-like protein (cupin superfamily)
MSETEESAPVILDAPGIAASASNRLAATLTSDDLNLNLLVLDAGEVIEAHVNSEVDVLVVAVDGQGEIVIDDQQIALTPGQALVIAKGARRAIRPIGGRFAYLSCHRRRAGLWPKAAPRKPECA